MKIIVVSAYTLTARVLGEWLLSPWTASLWKVRAFGNNLRINGKAVFMLEEAVNFLRLFFCADMYKKNGMILCESCHFSVLLFGKYVRFLGIHKRLYLFNFFLHDLGSSEIVQKILKFLLNQDVAMMAFSSSERDYFKKLAFNADIRFVPWGGEPGHEIDPLQIKRGDYIFAGGYSNRDYDLLIRCARKFPRQRFIIVCSRRNGITETAPPNVEIHKEISPKEFHMLLAGSMATVIPLKNNVGASGQMAALAAMEFGKPTIYADLDVISQYFENGKSGLKYEVGNAESLMAALSLLLEDQSAREKLGKRAFFCWERAFKGDRMAQAIADHLADFMGVALQKPD